MKGPRAHLHVVGLEDHAALRAPIVVERQDQVLEAQAQATCPVHQIVELALADGRCRSKLRAASSRRKLEPLRLTAQDQELNVTFVKRLFASIAALIALGATPAAAASVRPALWAVADADTTIYLFGTIHLLPQNYQWRTAKFDQAVEESQQLVLETIIDDKDPTKIMSAMSSLAFSPGLPPLAERVPPAKRAALAEAVKKSGFPPKALDSMETWAAAFILLGNQFHDMGLKGGEGVEAVFAMPSRPRANRLASSKAMSSSSASSTRCPKRRSATCSKGRSASRKT